MLQHLERTGIPVLIVSAVSDVGFTHSCCRACRHVLASCCYSLLPISPSSQGLTDVIEEFLRQHGALSENVTICSNRLNYEADATPKSVAPEPPITSFTKEYAYSSAVRAPSGFFPTGLRPMCLRGRPLHRIALDFPSLRVPLPRCA